jgi:hypothetical protein
MDRSAQRPWADVRRQQAWPPPVPLVWRLPARQASRAPLSLGLPLL